MEQNIILVLVCLCVSFMIQERSVTFQDAKKEKNGFFGYHDDLHWVMN